VTRTSAVTTWLDTRYVQQRDGSPGGGQRETPRRASFIWRTHNKRKVLLPELLDNGEAYWRASNSMSSLPHHPCVRLHDAGALRNFDPYPMVLRAARYLIQEGPATPQERWKRTVATRLRPSPQTFRANLRCQLCPVNVAMRRQRSSSRTMQTFSNVISKRDCNH